MDNYISQITSKFTLSINQTRLLYSFEYLKVAFDINQEKNRRVRSLKNNWAKRWSENVQASINDLAVQNNFDEKEFNLITNDEEFVMEMMKECFRNKENKSWCSMLLFETLLFNPYYPLTNNRNEKNMYRNVKCSLCNPYIENIASKLKYVDIDFLKKVRGSFNSAITNISGNSVITQAGLATSLLSSMTRGFDAISTANNIIDAEQKSNKEEYAMSIMGSGVLYDKDLGFPRDNVSVVSGGILIADDPLRGIGDVDKRIYSEPQLVLYQSSKLEAYIKEVVLKTNNDLSFADEVISKQLNKIYELEEYINNEKKEAEKGKVDNRHIQNLVMSLKYMKKSYKRINSYLQSYIKANIKKNEAKVNKK